MGATLFFGMTFVVLITQGAPETEYANPQKTMARTGFVETPPEVFRTPQAAWPTPFRLPDAILDQTRRAGPILRPNTDQPFAALLAPAPKPAVSGTIAPQAQVPAAPALTLRAVPDQPPLSRIGPASFPQALMTRNAVAPPTDPQRPGVTMRIAGRPGTPTGQSEALAWDRTQHAPVPSFSTPIISRTQGSDDLPSVPKPGRPTRVTADRVFLRDAPRLDGETLGQFDQDTPALMLEARGNWRRVEIEGQIGWMFARYLDPDRLP